MANSGQGITFQTGQINYFNCTDPKLTLETEEIHKYSAKIRFMHMFSVAQHLPLDLL